PSVLTLGDNNATASFTGTIQNGTGGQTLAITKIGSGTQTLSGNLTYTGDTTVNAGTLAIPTGTSLAGSNVIVNGGTFDLAGTTGANVTANGGVVSGAGAVGATL